VEELKRTNEIKMAIPLLEAIDIQSKQVTADALLTQLSTGMQKCTRNGNEKCTTLPGMTW
jgi:predicted transposase YbfD/YdcC